MKVTRVQFSVLTVLLILVTGNVVMALMSLYLLGPSLLGVFCAASLAEWTRTHKLHFVSLAVGAGFGCIAEAISSIHAVMFLRSHGAFQPALGAMLAQNVASFMACVFGTVGGVGWLWTGVCGGGGTGDKSNF